MRALVLWLCVGTALAQTGPFSISGTVVDPSGASVPDATVQLQRPAGRTLQTARTDISGTFQLSAVSLGAYLIHVQHDGFKEAAVQVRVSARPVASLPIRLELAALFSEASAEFEPIQVSTAVAENRDAATVDNNLLEKLPVFDQITSPQWPGFWMPAQSGRLVFRWWWMGCKSTMSA